VVRHAERADDGTDDPPLTDAGATRAHRLADRLQPLHGVAVYASPYRRAQATAGPTSLAWDVPVTTYDPAEEAGALLTEVVRDHPSGAILIVGHSNTVPEIVGALCRCPVDGIDEDDFGKLYQVTLDASGAVIDFQSLDNY
jgi:broad specificity phosphatase PhoE